MKLSIIITVNKSGLFVYRTLLNIKKFILSKKDKIEVICLIDSKDDKSMTFLDKGSSFINNLKVYKYNDLDISEVKNSVVRDANGEFLLFLDGGNLLSFNLIRELSKEISRNAKFGEETIFVPETKIFFGKDLFLEKNLSTEDPSFFNSILFFENPWNNNFVVSKTSFNKIQFSKVDFKNKINPHILSFFSDCLGFGFKVKLIPKTISFIRLKDGKDLEEGFILSDKSIFANRSKKIKKKEIRKMSNFDNCTYNNTFLDKHPNLYLRIRRNCKEVKGFILKVSDKSDNRNILKKVFSLISPQFYLKIHVLKKKVKGFNQKVTDESDKRNILKRIFSSISPKFYVKIHTLKKKIRKDFDTNSYPKWLTDEWKAINSIEPVLYPKKWNINERKIVINSKIEIYLKEIISNFPKNIDYLIFCPWLKIGGADKLTINLINALRELFPKKKIGIITTETVTSECLDSLPEGVSFFDFGNSFLDLNWLEKRNLLLRAIIQIKANKIININSHKLFELLNEYSSIISSYSDIYCFAFCVYITEEGQTLGFAVDNIPLIIDNLKMVLTDNCHISSYLIENFGLDRQKFQTIYQPVDTDHFEFKEFKKEDIIDILWASRIDDQKLPYVLEKIIKESQGKNFRFHIYGGLERNYSYDIKNLEKYENVLIYGPFKGGFVNINYKEYDLYLFTSKFEGIPISILEALSLGFPIVSSNVGGISEIIKDNETGFLVDDIYNPNAYLEKIYKIINNEEVLKKIELNSKKAIESQHSWNGYLQVIKQIFA